MSQNLESAPHPDAAHGYRPASATPPQLLLFDIVVPTTGPVFYYTPRSDPTRIYQVSSLLCTPSGGGVPATFPIVSLVSSFGVSNVPIQILSDYQIQCVGVHSFPSSVGETADPETILWYRLASLFAGDFLLISHRLFLNPQPDPWPDIPDCLTVDNDSIGRPSINILQLGGTPQYIVNTYPIELESAPAVAYLQQSF
jgi:hypothetical protein